MRRDQMPPHMRTLVEAEVARLDGPQRSPGQRAHGPAPKRTDGYRSRAEADYATWLASCPECVAWDHEPLTIRLPGAGTRYTPDFLARWACSPPGWAWVWPQDDRRRLAVEVKGTKVGRPWWRGDSRTRALHGAAALHAVLDMTLCVAWKHQGTWQHEIVRVRP